MSFADILRQSYLSTGKLKYSNIAIKWWSIAYRCFYTENVEKYDEKLRIEVTLLKYFFTYPNGLACDDRMQEYMARFLQSMVSCCCQAQNVWAVWQANNS